MKIGFVVNDVKTEQVGYTTTRLGMWAINRGHEVWVIGLADFAYDPDENIRARAYSVPKRTYKTTETYLKALQGKTGISERITVDELDILMLRSDPANEVGSAVKHISPLLEISIGVMSGSQALTMQPRNHKNKCNTFTRKF